MNKHNCLYCNKELNDNGTPNFFQCKDCNSNIITDRNNNNRLTYFEVKTEGYTVGVYPDEYKCKLFINTYQPETFKPVLTLNYIPEINPSNVKDWIDRILALKCFL
jgi:hypothetical protein